MSDKRICPVCGKEFPVTVSNRKYCCPECKRQAVNAAERKYYAANSDAIKLRLKIKKSKSAEETKALTEAYAKIEKPQLVLTCQMCGKQFPAKSPKQKFCSPECSALNEPIRKREWRLHKLASKVDSNKNN